MAIIGYWRGSAAPGNGGAAGDVTWTQILGKPSTFPPEAHGHAWGDITGKPSVFAPAAHGHQIGDVTGLQGALDGKAAAAAVPTTEALQDLVAAMFQGGTHTNASVAYDDAAGTISITAAGGGGSTLTQEQVEDFVGGLVQTSGTGISVVYDDAGNVLRITLTGESFTTAEKNKLAAIAAGATANSADAQLLARANHTGTQAIATVDGLAAALDARPTAAAAVISTTIRKIVRLTEAEYQALPAAEKADASILYART